MGSCDCKNPGKDSQIYLAQFSPFHLNKLNDLSDLLNITT